MIASDYGVGVRHPGFFASAKMTLVAGLHIIGMVASMVLDGPSMATGSALM